MPKRPSRPSSFSAWAITSAAASPKSSSTMRAGEIGLAWKASSRALTPEPATRNVGPMALVAIQPLEEMGIRASADFARLPLEVTTAELDQAHLIVALKHTEHLPMLQERFPAWAEKVEFWDVDDDPKVLGLIEKELADLIARLIVGGKRGDSPVQRDERPAPTTAEKWNAPANGSVVRVGRETKGRRGKRVTTVTSARPGTRRRSISSEPQRSI